MKPNFETMSTAELTAYVKIHRDNLEAIDALVSRRSPDEEATWYPAPCTSEGVPIEENLRIMEEAIRQRIEKAKN
jgi:hypothetical protein